MKHFLILVFSLLSIAAMAQPDGNDENINSPDRLTQVKKWVEQDIRNAWRLTNAGNDSALYFIEKAFRLSKKEGYTTGTVMAMEARGLFYEIAKENYTAASEEYFKAMELCDKYKLGYKKEVLHTLAVLFHTTDNYKKAKLYYNQALELAIKNRDTVLQKKCICNLGSVYSSLKLYDSALVFFQRALVEYPSVSEDYSIYVNIGNLYNRKEEYRKALPFLEKSIENVAGNKDRQINLRFYLDTRAALKDFGGMDEVISSAKQALLQLNTSRERSLLTLALANYYQQKEDYKTALSYFESYVHLYEKLKEKQRDDAVYELETKYRTEKTREELVRRKSEQRIYLVLSILGLALSVLLGILFYKNRNKKIELSKKTMLLQQAVDDNNTLLRETHHRVKNSFQIVSNLLYLQSENILDENARRAVKEAETRVRSMVLIHQKLYNKNELIGVDTREYFSDLIKDIVETHAAQEHKPVFVLDIESHILNIETITPLGLILNELATNVMKHAFPIAKQDAKFSVSFRHCDRYLELIVSDNGTGLSDFIQETSFGITLIRALSKKLKATLDYQNKNGTTATLIVHNFKLL